jgi:hypothetical protein
VRIDTVTYKVRLYKHQPVIYGLDLINDDDDITFTDNH